MRIQDYIELNFATKTTEKHIRFCCPFCNDTRFRMYLLAATEAYRERFICFNNSCGWANQDSYTALQFIADYNNLTLRKAKAFLQDKPTLDDYAKVIRSKTVKNKTVDVTPQIKLPVLVKILDYPNVANILLAYLDTRGITQAQVESDNLMYCPDENTIFIPVIIDGVVVGGQHHFWTGNSRIKYKTVGNKSAMLWNSQHIDACKPIYVFEGYFNARSVDKVNVVCTFGKQITDSQVKSVLNTGCQHIVLCLDTDAVAETLKYCKVFASYSRQVSYCETQEDVNVDWNDIYMAESCKVSISQYQQAYDWCTSIQAVLGF